MRQYADPPMDFGDAPLLSLPKASGHRRIASTDQRDFRAYRWKARNPFQNLLGDLGL
jgi:predicted nucleic acid-binding protein